MATLIISNAEMDNIMKIVKSFDESGFLMRDSTKTIKNEAKKQKCGFINMSLGTLGAS